MRKKVLAVVVADSVSSCVGTRSPKVPPFHSFLRLHCELHQVLHEHPERHIVGEDLRPHPAPLRVVRRAGIELGHEEAGLGFVLVADDVPGDWEARVHDHLRVCLGRLHQAPEGRVLLLLVVLGLPPLGDRLPVEDNDVEEGIEEEDGVRPHRGGVQQGRLRRAAEGVRQQRGLDHDEAVGRPLPVEDVAVVRRLVGAGVEELEELRPPQVEEELGEEAELRRQAERAGVVGLVVGELCAEADEGAVDPAEDVGGVLGLGALHGQSGHEDGGALLIEGGLDGVHVPVGHRLHPPRRRDGLLRRRVMPRPAQRRSPEAGPAVGVLVPGEELDEPPLALRQGAGAGVGDVKVQRDRGGRVAPAQGPGARSPLPHLDVRHAGPLPAQAPYRADGPADLELPGGQDLEGGPEGHLQLASVLGYRVVEAAEAPAETLLEDGLAERVSEHHEAPGGLDELRHLQHPHLVQAAREDVHGVQGGRGGDRDGALLPPLGAGVALGPLLGQAGVVLARGLVERLGRLGQVGVAAHDVRADPADDGPGSRGARSPREEHDPPPRAGEGQLEQSHRHAQGAPSAPSGALLRGDRPGILPEVVEDGLHRHGAIGRGEEEAVEDVLARPTGPGPPGLLGVGSRGLRSPGLLLLLLLLLLVGPVGVAAQQLPDLPRPVFLVAADDVGLGHPREAQLVDLDVGPEGDQAHPGVPGEEVDGLLQGVCQLRQLLGHGAGVDDEEEGGRAGVGDRGQLVLRRAVLRDDLGGEVGFADVLGVVGGEVVAGQAERAGPELAAEVDLAVRVEDRLAGRGGAADGIVLEGRGRGAGGRKLAERAVERPHRRHAAGRLEARRRPAVEGQAGPRRLLRRGHVPRLVLHGGSRWLGLGWVGVDWGMGFDLI